VEPWRVFSHETETVLKYIDNIPCFSRMCIEEEEPATFRGSTSTGEAIFSLRLLGWSHSKTIPPFDRALAGAVFGAVLHRLLLSP